MAVASARVKSLEAGIKNTFGINPEELRIWDNGHVAETLELYGLKKFSFTEQLM